MATTLYLSPLTMLIQYFTNIGLIAAGATVTTQLAGSTSTLQTTYTDSSGLVPNANPMTLNSAGRPAGSSGAVVAFWQPAGVAIDVYFTDTLGETWSIKNLPGINDQSASGSLQALLASPASANSAGSGPVGGADFVANAVKSYDIFADVRAANVPMLASGQTLIIDVEGALSIGDGAGGLFYWNATSSAADDGATVLKPNAASGNGRWLRQVLPNTAVGTSGTFTMTTTDVTGGTESATVFYSQAGNNVTLTCLTPFTGTSASTTFTLSGLPATLQPARSQPQPIFAGATDNSSGCGCSAQVVAATIVFSKVTPSTLAAGAWTASGTKAIPGFTLSYSLV